jgi:ABC-type phosphate transport system auxiliary subunit
VEKFKQMSKQKNPPASHQKTLQKINTLYKEVEDFNKQCIQSVNHNHGKIRVLEMVLEHMLEDDTEEHEFTDFEESVFNKEYGFLFANYFIHMESKNIIKVNFPEVEQEDELLDDSK